MVHDLLTWFDEHARDLPWRHPDVTAWGVLLCEVMSQQTPVARVVPVWREWLDRWPTPTALADDSPGEAVRLWARLGYPRRALRLHQAAVLVRDRHGGELPVDEAGLLTLPGVGPYTAAATAAFAHGRRTVVLDVNVRRVLARVHDGVDARPGAPVRAEVQRAERLLPAAAAESVRWNAAVMELGALVCTARAPRCLDCPIRAGCSWAGTPPGPHERARTTRPQTWQGSDRQVRGLLLDALRQQDGTVPRERLQQLCEDPEQTERCLRGLLLDGLVEAGTDGFRLPT